MKRSSGVFLGLLVTGCLVTIFGGSASAQEVAVRGRVVYPVSQAPIENGVVWIRQGKIQAIGTSTEITLPEGIPVLEAEVVTPGLIDAHTVVGLSGALNQPHDQDQLERSAPMQPELRAIDAYNPRERLVDWVRSFGVTTIHTGHAPGQLISGQTMIVKTTGETVDDALMVPFAMVAATLGPAALSNDKGKSPGTRAKAVALLRGQFLEAREYLRKRNAEDPSKRPAANLRLDALAKVLTREVPFLVTAQASQDLMAALRVAREFDLDLVLDGAADSHLLLDELAAAEVPVILHPPMMRAHGDGENATMETALLLADRGIPFAFQSGFEAYVPKTRVVLFEAAIAAGHDLPFEATLRALTLGAAEILGVEERVGSLDPGKDGDVVLFDGDPFEYTSHVTGVVIDGRVVSDSLR